MSCDTKSAADAALCFPAGEYEAARQGMSEGGDSAVRCVEAQFLINPYLNDELPDHELEEFLKHIETCDDCREELGIYLAINRTLEATGGDDPDSYDFKDQLREKLLESENRLQLHRMQHMAVWALFAVILLVMSILVDRKSVV